MENRIAILTSSDFPYHGAPESFVRQMALGLYKNGAEVEVIRFWGDRYSCKNDLPIKSSNYFFSKPFKNEALKFFETLFQVIYIPIFLVFRKMIKKDQVLLLYGLDRAYFVWPTTIFCRILGLKCFRIITEIYPDYLHTLKWWRKPNVLFEQWQIKYFDRFLTGILVLSRFLQELEIKHKVKKENILLIPNFIDLELQNEVTENKDKNITRIGFCGHVSLENGILDLLSAYLKLSVLYKNHIELIIIGNISPSIRTEINKIINGNERIIFTGLLKKNEVIHELLKCDILVNPRRSGILADSGFPTKIGEYFAAHKPVIATKVGDLQHYFTDKKELVFAEPNNPDSIYEALKFLLSNRIESFEIAERGTKWAVNNLDYFNNSRKLLSFMIKNIHN